MRIVLGSSILATYPAGGGNWMIGLQYLLGLAALGTDVLLLEILHSSGNPEIDRSRVNTFFETFKRFNCEDKCVLLLLKPRTHGHNCEQAEYIGHNKWEVDEFVRSADLLWNLCGSIDRPLLDQFRHRVFLDLDPGHTQVSALSVDMNLPAHETLLTVGSKMHSADCAIPTLDRQWKPFVPFVYLPLWKPIAAPDKEAPFTSITHWNWEELELDGRSLSLSKREAYLRYLDLPQRTGQHFELAVSLEPEDDPAHDRQQLLEHGWRLVDPWKIAATPEEYRNYIVGARAEICCPKPIFRELKTGWISDRSVCFLASGRPVLAEDTGFSDVVPGTDGMVAFHNMEEAVAGVARINAEYEHQCRAARGRAEDFFDSQKCLTSMLTACG